MKNIVARFEFNQDFSNILESVIIGVDGYNERFGTVEKITMQDHSVLGRLIQIWVKWNDTEKTEPFFPMQFNKHFEGSKPIGVYVA